MPMSTISYLQINGLALAILAVVFSGSWNRSTRYPRDQRLFRALVLSNAFMLIVDTGMWSFSGQSGATAGILLRTSTVLYFLVHPLPCLLWSLYAELQLNRGIVRGGPRLAFLSLPVVLHSVLVLISLKTGFLFDFTDRNTYARGPGIYITFIVCYGYLLGTTIQILLLRNRVRREERRSLLFFVIPPSLGGLIQILTFGLVLIWPGMVLSLLLIYLRVLYRRLRTDHLTGLHNRSQLEEYLAHKWNERGRRQLIAGIMIDVDSFKQINDRFGHAAGDEALERTGDILRSSLRNDDFICRYGGDEFAVVLMIHHLDDLTKAVARIHETAEQFNQMEETPYDIHLSCGYDVLDPNVTTAVDAFIAHLDRLMYESKKTKSTLRHP
ncbi:MAG: GGDEF domain-containing protein [Clostridiaceae bacterium]|nr:GGDEF domain-containing protein [Clostridiaceae bacterium]